ncbi:MAG: UDP-glucose/GDP-mannose dehydrogenase family protein [Rhodoferax sp.]|nr:UDP-glucose/GDP-mannose dehydrogenase family protein [Rhodoferax sp.]
MKITVFGAGYVGLVTAACLAEMGNSVVCVDVDAKRVTDLQRGISPIHEQGLEPLFQRNAAAGRLAFTNDVAAAVSHGTIVFIAVGTPAAEDGSADLQHVLAVAQSIGDHMSDYKLVVNKSTVPVGTADLVRSTIAAALRQRAAVLPYAVVSNPEFLKEGVAIDDFMRPDRVIVGCDNDQAALLMRALYAPFLRNRDRLMMMDVRSAELTKYVANAMLATRISFMNEMALLAEKVGADIEQVRVGIGSDTRIGSHFLYAGCGWGGSCFPKDVRALAHMASQAGTELGMLQATQTINDRQRGLLGQRVVARFGPDLSGLQFAVWGLAFKPGTDDMREAPSVNLIEELLQRGARVHAFDPAAMVGASERWQSQPGFVACKDPLAATDGSDALIVVTEWREFRSPDYAELRRRLRQPVVIDGRNLYDPELMAELGFDYTGIGRAQPKNVEAADSAGEKSIRALAA